MLVDRVVGAVWRLHRSNSAEKHGHDMIAARIQTTAAAQRQEMIDDYLDPHKPLEPQLADFDAEQRRRWDELEQQGGQRLPAAMTLALSCFDPDQTALERLARAQHRTQGEINRALRELRELRLMRRRDGELPPSPFVFEYLDMWGVAEQTQAQADATEPPGESADAPERSEMSPNAPSQEQLQNEATAPALDPLQTLRRIAEIEAFMKQEEDE